MDIKPLLDLTCAAVASMIKGKTPEEIRRCVFLFQTGAVGVFWMLDGCGYGCMWMGDVGALHLLPNRSINQRHALCLTHYRPHKPNTRPTHSTFNITNDFTPEEEQQVREENKWCEEV